MDGFTASPSPSFPGSNIDSYNGSSVLERSAAGFELRSLPRQ
jgi:hypothetical protein